MRLFEFGLTTGQQEAVRRSPPLDPVNGFEGNDLDVAVVAAGTTIIVAGSTRRVKGGFRATGAAFEIPSIRGRQFVPQRFERKFVRSDEQIAMIGCERHPTRLQLARLCCLRGVSVKGDVRESGVG